MRTLFKKLSAVRFATYCVIFTFFLSFAVVIASSVVTEPAHAAKRKDRAVEFMKKFAGEAMAAVRTGKKKKLEVVVRRYTDLKGLGLYSLGAHVRKLPVRSRPNYYRGMAKFMARYFMEQAINYNVVSAKVRSPSSRENGEIIVDTVVTLKDGTAYTVQWRLTKLRRTYKIRDVNILGFWLGRLQRDLFSNFVEERGGNVNDLVVALHYN